MIVPDLDQFVHCELFAPNVIVLATEAAQQCVSSATGLTITELLAPFGGFYTPMSVQYRVLDKVVRTNGFKVRFVDPSACQYLNNAEELGMLNFLDEKTKRSSANIFEKYFSGFCSGLKFAPFDCLSQPIATVLVVSATEPNPIDAFEQLSHVANQPEACRSGLLDPTSARIKLLIHDTKNGGDSNAILDQLKRIYTENSVAFFSFNSLETVSSDIGAIFGPKYSVPLTYNNVEALGRLCEQTIVKDNALPWLERKLQSLDNNITAKRKGLRNQLRNFLRSDNQTNAAASLSGQLSLQQVEWQCRLAGDIAFHLRAHETAFGYYRNVASEFKQDRGRMLAGAGCYEMSAICALLSAETLASSSEINRFAETAVELYKEGKPHAHNHVMRAAVFQSLVLRGRSEAAEKLIRINGEIVSGDTTSGLLRSAVILDLAAYLHGAAKMKRKEAFTRVLAGHMFNKVEGGKELALEAYSAVLSLYGPEWGFIRDHLLFTMAKLEFGLGRSHQSLALMTDLLKSSKGTAEKHLNYLKLLSYIAKQSSSDGVNFPIPIVSLHEKEIDAISVTNPLLVPLELSGLHFIFQNPSSAESETSGLIRLESGESRNISLMVVEDPPGTTPVVSAIGWTLFESLSCRFDILPVHV